MLVFSLLFSRSLSRACSTALRTTKSLLYFAGRAAAVPFGDIPIVALLLDQRSIPIPAVIDAVVTTVSLTTPTTLRTMKSLLYFAGRAAAIPFDNIPIITLLLDQRSIPIPTVIDAVVATVSLTTPTTLRTMKSLLYFAGRAAAVALLSIAVITLLLDQRSIPIPTVINAVVATVNILRYCTGQ